MTNPFRIKITFLLCGLCASLFCFGQSYADEEYYLIDSLDLDQVSPRDRAIIDSSLQVYHNTLEDTIALGAIEHIVDNCWDSRIWPRYNNFLIQELRQKLAINFNEKIEDKLIYFLAGAVSNKGYYYDESGRFIDALRYYHEGLRLYESIDNKQGISTSFNNLGVLYSIINDTSNALKYHKNSLEAKKELKDIEGIAMSYNNIGAIYENAGQVFVALEYYQSSLELRESLGDPRGMAMTYDNIGDIYFSEEVFGKAKTYYEKGYQYWVASEIEIGISTGLNNLANVHVEMGNYDQAKSYALESFAIAEKMNFPMDIANSAKTLINIYDKEKDYLNAFKYARIFIESENQIKNDENARMALKKSMEYEYQKETLKDSLEFEKERAITGLKIQEKENQTFVLIIGLVLSLIILVIGIRSFIQKKKDNQKINEQRIRVEEQKEKIELQHKKLEETHNEISASISYAKRIQNAILPSKEDFKRDFPNSFVFYRPKDIVAGDFYWMNKVGDVKILACADCTGHGVPGAMVSVVCNNGLNRSIREKNLTSPGEILDETRNIVISEFEKSSDDVYDGMDIALVSIKGNKLSYAGANNPIWILRKDGDEIEEIKADKQPIAQFEFNKKPFTTHQVELNNGDTFYIFSDGFADQFGGKKGKKFKSHNFMKLLLSIKNLSMNEQRDFIKDTFEKWKGDIEQVDDVCVIGVRYFKA